VKGPCAQLSTTSRRPHHVDVRGSGSIGLRFLNLGVRWEVSGQFHAPAALPPGNNPGIHGMGDWMGSRAGLDPVAKRKSFFPALACNRSFGP